MKMEKIKKVSPLYLIAYILLPVAVAWVVLLIAVLTLNDVAGPIVCIVVFAAAIGWWVCGSGLLQKRQLKKLEAELDNEGFIRSHTFRGKGCVVIVDRVHGQVALLFTWNPFKHFVFPAKQIGRAWVDDGRSGPGFMEASYRVSFFFEVNGVTVRADTFTSNRRWRMDSDYIRTGVSKAETMVGVLLAAKERSC